MFPSELILLSKASLLEFQPLCTEHLIAPEKENPIEDVCVDTSTMYLQAQIELCNLLLVIRLQVWESLGMLQLHFSCELPATAGLSFQRCLHRLQFVLMRYTMLLLLYLQVLQLFLYLQEGQQSFGPNLVFVYGGNLLDASTIGEWKPQCSSTCQYVSRWRQLLSVPIVQISELYVHHDVTTHDGTENVWLVLPYLCNLGFVYSCFTNLCRLKLWDGGFKVT